MIEAGEAVRTARSLIGTPYEDMDCIALLREVIRRTPGGDGDYRCEGTNWLWKSYNNVDKYRHLTWRGEGTKNAKAGMLVFKRRGEDVHHVGVATGEGTVVHASSEYAQTVETPLDESWHLLARHRLIMEQAESYGQGTGVVSTQGGRLNVRSGPKGDVIAQVENGTEIQILGEAGSWLRIALDGGREGFVSADYVRRTAYTGARIRVIDEAGNLFIPQGNFTVSVEGRD